MILLILNNINHDNWYQWWWMISMILNDIDNDNNRNDFDNIK